MSSCNAKFIYSSNFTDYTFHENHPFNQHRIELTKSLLECHHTLSDSDIVMPVPIDESLLRLIHTEDYIQAVKKASNDPSIKLPSNYGIGSADTPAFKGMFDAAMLLVSGTITACDLLIQNETDHVVNLGGGLHHGFPDHAAGFCIFNDIAIAIQYILNNTDWKVLYIDTDAHHGDGVQHCFYDDPRVCTVSFHETGRYLYPGTGKTSERGIKEGFGYSFNFPLDAFTEDESYLHVFNRAIDDICAYYQPDIIISQHGADAHYLDPLTHLHCTMDIFNKIPSKIHQLAHEYCNGKWLALGGGGYDIWQVVPRAWGQLWKIMIRNQAFTGLINKEWLSYWQDNQRIPLPLTWEDSLDEYTPIKRKPIITDYNNQILTQVLKFVENASSNQVK
ncbi:acetoin utilization protein AcuC [Gracilibacillus marinus]|uniref:Acetoin utilization protein AcuC n=1 Tax=Gracilibacillus marinus TaxID=630535 RepID=A0ABV8VWB4_9BACI